MPRDYKTEDGYRLGGWVAKQRQSEDGMSLERKAKLEALLGWEWADLQLGQKIWNEWILRLKEFVEYEGHCLPSAKFVTNDGHALGMWVCTQRANKVNLSPEQRLALEAIPGWVWDVKENKWETGFRYLKEFVSREGHAKAPQNYITGDGFRLGGWTGRQRQIKDRMTLERKVRLEALPGWVWRVE